MPTKPPTFRPAHLPTRQQQQRDYDRRRGNERERGYTKALRNSMDAFKRRNPLCLGCQATGMVAVTVIDHVIPAKGDQALLWDQGNWQPSCTWHHSVIKQQLERLFERARSRRLTSNLIARKRSS
jgi:5-methylcytosine-specific restriction enzyme A